MPDEQPKKMSQPVSRNGVPCCLMCGASIPIQNREQQTKHGEAALFCGIKHEALFGRRMALELYDPAPPPPDGPKHSRGPRVGTSPILAQELKSGGDGPKDGRRLGAPKIAELGTLLLHQLTKRSQTS